MSLELPLKIFTRKERSRTTQDKPPPHPARSLLAHVSVKKHPVLFIPRVATDKKKHHNGSTTVPVHILDHSKNGLQQRVLHAHVQKSQGHADQSSKPRAAERHPANPLHAASRPSRNQRHRQPTESGSAPERRRPLRRDFHATHAHVRTKPRGHGQDAKGPCKRSERARRHKGAAGQKEPTGARVREQTQWISARPDVHIHQRAAPCCRAGQRGIREARTRTTARKRQIEEQERRARTPHQLRAVRHGRWSATPRAPHLPVRRMHLLQQHRHRQSESCETISQSSRPASGKQCNLVRDQRPP